MEQKYILIGKEKWKKAILEGRRKKAEERGSWFSQEAIKKISEGNTKPREKIFCANCGKERKHYPCEEKRSKNLFCNKKCKAEWMSKNLIREKSNYWNGGKYKTSDGYIVTLMSNHPNCDKEGYVREHRRITEKLLGRYLDRKEIVHHLNFLRDDNRPENLVLFESQSKHMTFHKKLQQFGLTRYRIQEIEERKIINLIKK